jgi:hypothetical protein
MKLVYRLLAEDLIEKAGRFYLPENGAGEEALIDELCLRIEEAPGTEGELIHKTLRSFVASGFLKFETIGTMVRWFWTHNNRVDHHPI